VIFDNPFLIFGGPGCGKTEGLLKMIEKDLEAGMSPDRIAFTSFTREAAYGARRRAADKIGLEEDMLPWFRTLHSLAFRAIGILPSEVMQRSHLKEFFQEIGYKHGHGMEIGPATAGPDGDVCLSLVEYARASMRPLREVFDEHGPAIPWVSLDVFDRALRAFKAERNIFDFTDILEIFVRNGKSIPVEFAYIDEAQDLTRLQWEVARVAFAHCAKVMICGDDDQAVYKWTGANVNNFLNIHASSAVLDHSWRLPRKIHALAGRVAQRIGIRQEKNFGHNGTEGEIHFHNSHHRIDLADEQWLLLARNRYRLEALEDLVRDQGYLYSAHGKLSYDPEFVRSIQAYETMRKGKAINQHDAYLAAAQLGLPCQFEHDDPVTLADIDAEGRGIWWQAFKKVPTRDKEYLISAIRRGDDPMKAPRIRLDTFHGAKGAEADNVAVITDISKRCMDGMRLSPDDEHRCFYVALTRASKALHIVAPQTNQFYSV